MPGVEVLVVPDIVPEDEAPLRHWDRRAPCVRAHYARRVCVVGAESSGTTALARALAAHYRTVRVPEFARVYREAQQNRLEDELARSCNRLLFCETDALATALWHERSMGFAAPEVMALSAGRSYALYLEELRRRGTPCLLLEGPHEARLSGAVAACDRILQPAGAARQ